MVGADHEGSDRNIVASHHAGRADIATEQRQQRGHQQGFVLATQVNVSSGRHGCDRGLGNHGPAGRRWQLRTSATRSSAGGGNPAERKVRKVTDESKIGARPSR